MKSIKIKILLSVIFIFGVFYLFPHNNSFAEIEIGVQESDINAEIIPENPQPYQDVTIKLTSYATDLNKAMIVWQNGSNIALSGYGKTTYTFKAFGPDSVSIFDIKITPVGEITSVSKRIVINPSEVILMWEAADGYTPPFYRGKSFVSAGGNIKVVAIPNTNTIKSGKGNVVYTWKSNDNTILNASGYGKDYFIFKNSLLKDEETVNVSSSSLNNKYNAQNKIVIPIIPPKIIFYKKSPTEGVMYNNAIEKETGMTGSQMTIVAEPYFLASKNKEDSFNYDWTINGDKINTPNKRTELTIKPTSTGGYAEIGLEIKSLSELFQDVSNQIRINL